MIQPTILGITNGKSPVDAFEITKLLCRSSIHSIFQYQWLPAVDVPNWIKLAIKSEDVYIDWICCNHDKTKNYSSFWGTALYGYIYIFQNNILIFRGGNPLLMCRWGFGPMFLIVIPPLSGWFIQGGHTPPLRSWFINPRKISSTYSYVYTYIYIYTYHKHP